MPGKKIVLDKGHLNGILVKPVYFRVNQFSFLPIEILYVEDLSHSWGLKIQSTA